MIRAYADEVYRDFLKIALEQGHSQEVAEDFAMEASLKCYADALQDAKEAGHLLHDPPRSKSDEEPPSKE